ncbi:MAG: hypothetical protein ACI4QI_05370 [Candidatus Coproplasma sp.]
MIKRSKFLSALLCIILSLVCAFGLIFAGCGEYKPPENNGDNPVDPVDPVDPDNPDDPVDENANDFTVQLMVKSNSSSVWEKFTNEYYEASDGKEVHEQGWIKWETIRVQWTNVETGARHYANLNKDGKAVCAGLDGDYKVTLTSLPTGFTYEPNINYTDNISKHIEVDIYQLQKESSTRTIYSLSDHSIKYTLHLLKNTGAYRTVLYSRDDKVMFAFQSKKQGTFSLTTLVDVTENKINPKLTKYNGNLSGNYVTNPSEYKDDGGSENTYTKNIYWEYNISADEIGGNAFFFELSSTSIDGNDSYPITVDFLLQRDGDFTRTEYVTTPVKVTEDFTKTPAQPEGTFTWAARNSVTDGLVLSSKKVILNTETGRLADYLKMGATVEMGTQATLNDGYYYFFTYNEATNTYTLTDRLYAVIGKENEILDISDSSSWNFRYLQDCDEPTKFNNYLEFADIYKEHCNEDGAYPVNAELAKFLQDFCITKQVFNDGNGLAETVSLTYTDANGVTVTSGYSADEKGMWLFSCGYYKQ